MLLLLAHQFVEFCRLFGDLGLADAVGLLAPLRERVGRDINPVVMTRAEFRAERKRRERFVTRVMAEPKLFVIGTSDELG